MSHGRDLPPARRRSRVGHLQNQAEGQTGHLIPQSVQKPARRSREPTARQSREPSARNRAHPSAVQTYSTDAPPYLAPTREAAVPPPPPSGGQTAAPAVQARDLPVRRERTARSTQSTPREANRANGPSAAACAGSARPVHAAQQSSAASTDGTSRRPDLSCPCVSPPCRCRSPRVFLSRTSLEKRNPDRDGRGSPLALPEWT